MKGRALLAGMIALAVGLLAFLFVQFREDGARVGVRKAEACTEASPGCLPSITFVDTAGEEYEPSTLAGKVVVVNFWATWCQPCQREIPDLVKVYERYKDRGVVLLGILTDAPSEGRLADVIAGYKINYPIVPADAELMRAFGDPENLPTTFVYDRSGHVTFAEPGALTAREFEKLLDDVVE